MGSFQPKSEAGRLVVQATFIIVLWPAGVKSETEPRTKGGSHEKAPPQLSAEGRANTLRKERNPLAHRKADLSENG